MKNLSEPTIFLYLYDLKQALGDDAQDKVKCFEQFLEKLPDQLQKKLRSQEDEDREFNAAFDLNGYQELYSESFFDAPQADNKNQYLGEGWYYPISIFDTYALLIAVSLSKSDEVIKPFETLKEELKQRLNRQKGSLGQTWKLSGILPPTEGDAISLAETYAEEYYKEFLPSRNWRQRQDYFGKGQFLGSPIFELNSTEKYCNHTLISFFVDQEAYDVDKNKYYDDWILLLSFRHKIVWLYQKIEEVFNETKTLYSELEKIRGCLRQNLSNQEDLKALRKTLRGVQDLLVKYRRNLYYIQFSKKAIEINLENYQERLKLMEYKAKQEWINGDKKNTNLSFLNQFSERVEKKFLRQTDKNYEFLTLGLNFLESQMSDIRDRLAVERAERDRNFQDIIVIAGAGWAVGTLIQSVEFGKLENGVGYRPFLPPSWSNPTAQFVYAFASAFVSALIVWLVIYLWRNHNYKK